MPNDAKTGTSSTQYYTSSSTESMKIDISNYDNIYKTFSGEKPVKKKKENKKEFAEELQSFNCDGCGNRFKGLYSEMNEGFYCSPKCKIDNKYIKSALSDELFEENPDDISTA